MGQMKEIPWYYCECGCHCHAVTLAADHYTVYNDLKGNLCLYRGHSSLGGRLGIFKSFDEVNQEVKRIARERWTELAKILDESPPHQESLTLAQLIVTDPTVIALREESEKAEEELKKQFEEMVPGQEYDLIMAMKKVRELVQENDVKIIGIAERHAQNLKKHRGEPSD